MRADRLLSILLLLQNKTKQTTKQLAQLLEVSERTILRDMEDLSSAGFPVYAERGSNGGWRLSEGYQTRLTGLKKEEVQALMFSHSSTVLDDLGIKQSFEMAFQKLLASTPSAVQQNIDFVRDRIHIDGAGWYESKEKFPHLPLLQEAVWQQKKVLMTYQKGQDEIIRVVCPLGLVAMRNIWYMVAFIEEENEIFSKEDALRTLEESEERNETNPTEKKFRSYRISRITQVQLLEQTFLRPENFNLAKFWETSTQQFRAILPHYVVRVEMNRSLLKHLDKLMFVQMLHYENLNAERVKAELLFNTLESATEIILGLHDQLKVLEPPELINEIRSKAGAILCLYD